MHVFQRLEKHPPNQQAVEWGNYAQSTITSPEPRQCMHHPAAQLVIGLFHRLIGA
jgi:hypothetical protein